MRSFSQSRYRHLSCPWWQASQPPSLLLVNFDHVVLLHLKCLWSLVIVDATSIEEEAQRGDWDPDSLAVALLQFAHLCGLLHPEVDLVAVLPDDFQFDVLGLVASHLGLFSSGTWQNISSLFHHFNLRTTMLQLKLYRCEQWTYNCGVSEIISGIAESPFYLKLKWL